MGPRRRISAVDEWTVGHLDAWLERYGPPGQEAQEEARELILDMVAAHPRVLERGDSWPEILSLARRNRDMGLLPNR